MLSIRQKLTLIFSLLSAMILILCGIFTFSMVRNTIRKDGERLIQARAEASATNVYFQWDDDFLSEIGIYPDLFATIRGQSGPWAAVRGDGRVLFAAGSFEEELSPEVFTSPRVVRSKNGTRFRVLSTPLIPDYPITLENLPDWVKQEVFDGHPERIYVKASAELPGTAYEVLTVTGHTLEETTVKKGASGKTRTLNLPDSCVETPGEDAAVAKRKTILGKFIQQVLQGLPGWSCDSVDWTGHNGQLIVVLRGTDEDGAVRTVASNRVGELFDVDSSSKVVGHQDESRMLIMVGVDVEGELTQIRQAGQWVVLACLTAWISLSTVGWFVSRVSMAPIRRIVKDVDRIGSNLRARIPVRSLKDEVAEIQDTVNVMLERIEQGVRRERHFLSNASHELRSPLAKMRGEIDLILSQPRDREEYLGCINKLHSYVESMRQLIESLLLMARLDSRRGDLDLSRVDLGDVVANVIGTSESGSRSRLHLRIAPSDRPYIVLGQEQLIRTCVRNLVENGLRYSPEGEPVSIELDSRDGVVAMEVVDHGPGIAPEHRKHVFERFYRIESSRSKDTGGVGIGLAIVKAICDACNVRLQLAENGQGTRVRLLFQRG